MKKIVILFFALLSAYGAQAQAYRPMSTFGRDSIAYMRYNFVDRKAQYIGQPVSKLLNDYELELAVSHPTTTYPYAPGANGQAWVRGMIIQYTYWFDRELPYGRVSVEFRAPLLPWRSTFDSMADTDDDAEWTEKLKNQIVDDIRVSVGPYGPGTPPSRFTITGPEHPTPGMSEFRTDVSAYAPLTIAWQITPQTGVLDISPVGNGNSCSVQFSQASVNINYSVTATASNRHGTTKAYYNFVMNPGESSWLRKTTPEETDSEETDTE